MAEFVTEHLTKMFSSKGRELVAIQDVSLTIADREFVSVVGASGSGKSTLLNLLAGFEKPTSGRILLDGKQIDGPGPDRGVVFQQSALYPWLDVKRNIEFGLRLA